MVNDVLLTTLIEEIIIRVYQEDPVRSKWCIGGPELDVWVDASSQATGVLLEHDGDSVEDAKKECTAYKLGRGRRYANRC